MTKNAVKNEKFQKIHGKRSHKNHGIYFKNHYEKGRKINTIK